MAALNKILVHVPSNLCDGFKTKYVTATTNRDTSYDKKVVFLEKTQEIFTKGKLYGTNIGDFNDLKALVGTIPSDATSTNIIDYINEKITSADHIHSVSKKSGETLIEVATENKNVTINSTSALTTAVSNANSAVQSVSVLGKTLDKTTNYLTVEEAKEALGLGTAASFDSSYFVDADNIEYTASYSSSRFVYGSVTTKNGKVIRFHVEATTDLINAYNNANSATQSIDAEDKYLNIRYDSRNSYISLNEDNVFNYISENIWEDYTE